MPAILHTAKNYELEGTKENVHPAHLEDFLVIRHDYRSKQ